MNGDRGVGREYAVLVSHWDDGWDVFVLDPRQGLVATTRAATLHDVDWAANVALSSHWGVPSRRFNLRVIETSTRPGDVDARR